jgi:hypothetical protein
MSKVAPLFLDLEFTDLDPDDNEIWEIGWILDVEGQTVSCQNWTVEHTAQASQWVLRNSSYTERILKPRAAGIRLPELSEALEALDEDIKAIGVDYSVYIVGACPIYDMEYLRRAYKKYGRKFLFHWRPIAIESVFLGYQNAKGIKTDAPIATAKMMKTFGFTESTDKHSTQGDNEEVRRLYYELFQ